MKGIVLAGGKATRLRPLTLSISKHLLPVYDKPMVYYPIQTLLRAGITDILIISAPEQAGHFLRYLGTGKDFGARFSYAIQEQANGISEAYIIAEDFLQGESSALILGDNLFTNDFSQAVQSFSTGGVIFAKSVDDPERYGVVEMEGGRAVSIEEKPKQPKSNLAITGFYIFDSGVVEVAKSLSPSARGELEIVDIHNHYLAQNKLQVELIDGYWEDAGTFDSLLKASNFMKGLRG